MIKSDKVHKIIEAHGEKVGFRVGDNEGVNVGLKVGSLCPSPFHKVRSMEFLLGDSVGS